MARRLLPRTLVGLPARDVVLAVALCVFAAGGLISGAVQERPLVVTLPIAVVSTLLMAVRTRFPTAVAAVITALSLVQAVLAHGTSSTLWSLLVFLVVAYTVAAEGDEGLALVGLAIVLAGQFLGEWLDHGSDYAFVVLVFGGVWLFGRGTRAWHNQAINAEQHQRDLAQLAVANERARIARELHDVVAHSLSVIAVQADAADAALLKAPERALAPMRAIRESAQDALVDMRQMLHVLRDAGETDDFSPARGIHDLHRLIDVLRASGLPVRADIRVRDGLPPGLELAAFRISQEGLTNAVKHAGNVATRLLVASEGDELRIEVHNAAPTTAHPVGHSVSTGHGLIGIRERAQAAGGTVEDGDTPTGGHFLVVRLPLTREGP